MDKLASWCTVAPINVNAAKPTEKRIELLSLLSSNSLFFFFWWWEKSGYLYELRQASLIMYTYIWVKKEKENNPWARNLTQGTERRWRLTESCSKHPQSASISWSFIRASAEGQTHFWFWCQSWDPPHPTNMHVKKLLMSLSVQTKLLTGIFYREGNQGGKA